MIFWQDSHYLMYTGIRPSILRDLVNVITVYHRCRLTFPSIIGEQIRYKGNPAFSTTIGFDTNVYNMLSSDNKNHNKYINNNKKKNKQQQKLQVQH